MSCRWKWVFIIFFLFLSHEVTCLIDKKTENPMKWSQSAVSPTHRSTLSEKLNSTLLSSAQNPPRQLWGLAHFCFSIITDHSTCKTGETKKVKKATLAPTVFDREQTSSASTTCQHGISFLWGLHSVCAVFQVCSRATQICVLLPARLYGRAVLEFGSAGQRLYGSTTSTFGVLRRSAFSLFFFGFVAVSIFFFSIASFLSLECVFSLLLHEPDEINK